MNTKITAWIVGIVIVIVVLAAAAFSYQKQTEAPVIDQNPGGSMSTDITATFFCSNNKKIDAVFSDDEVALSLSDGRQFSLPIAMSGSGARYANPDETTVFWNKGNTAFITENGKETYSNCATKDDSPENTATSSTSVIIHSTPPPVNVGGGAGMVACTMEAKQCPDGSYVGRQGPNCEFAACPSR